MSNIYDGLRDQLKENVGYIALNLPDESGDVAQWIDDPDFEALDVGEEAREAIAFSYGYLRGVADSHGLTVLQLLDRASVDVQAEVTAWRARA